MNSQFVSYATVANLQELICRVLKGVSGNEIASKANDKELSEDVGAALNSKIRSLGGV